MHVKSTAARALLRALLREHSTIFPSWFWRKPLEGE